MSTSPVQGNSNLEQYIDKTSIEPVKCLSEALIRYMIDHPEWYASCNFNNDSPIDFDELCWNQRPEIMELKDLLESKFQNFTINEDNTFHIRGCTINFRLKSIKGLDRVSIKILSWKTLE
jgi:hypothetical protein